MEFIAAYALTLAVEIPVLLVLLGKQHGWKLTARNGIVASSLTLPFVWFVFPSLGLGYWPALAVSEIFAFAAEAGIYFALFKKIGARRAIVASAACNSASFILGMAADSFLG